jgi:hypothetical protein
MESKVLCMFVFKCAKIVSMNEHFSMNEYPLNVECLML